MRRKLKNQECLPMNEKSRLTDEFNAPELKAPSKTKLLKALHQLEKNPDSKERLFGDIGITALGGALGAAAGGTAAAAVGVTGIWGITTAASWLGLSVVSATPVGWIAGIAIAGAAAGYEVSRLIRGGAYTEGKLAELKRELKDRIKTIDAKEKASTVSESDLTEFSIFLKEPLEKNLLDSERAYKLMWAVEQGRMEISTAYQLVGNLLFKEIQREEDVS